jgi:hypothetical protein
MQNAALAIKTAHKMGEEKKNQYLSETKVISDGLQNSKKDKTTS